MQSPNEDVVHILAPAGSFRKGSLNQALIRTARELTPYQVRTDDFCLRTVPFYDGNLDGT